MRYAQLLKKYLFIICLIVGIAFYGYQIAEAAANRDEIIGQELDCVAARINNNQNLGWDDICYTQYAKSYEAEPVVVKKVGNITKLSDAYKTDVSNITDEDVRLHITEGRDENFFYRIFDFTNPLNDFDVGGEMFSYKYEEPDFMELNGTMFGAFAGYTFRTSENDHFESWKDAFKMENAVNMWRLDARGSYGQLDYESNGTGELKDEDHYAFEVRATFGEDIPGPKKTRITPFSGIGWRYLLDDNGGKRTTTNHWTYDREANYYYVPLGVEVYKDLKSDFSITVIGEYDLFIDGQQISHFEDGPAGSNYDKLSNDQDKGYGLRGSIRLTKRIEKFEYFAEPFFRYWSIEDSDISPLMRGGVGVPCPINPDYILGGLEPANKTTEIGLKAGVKF